MTRLGTKTVVAAAALAGIVVASSPAFAWECTARNARGAFYTAVGPVLPWVRGRALFRCRRDSHFPRSCVIVHCS